VSYMVRLEGLEPPTYGLEGQKRTFSINDVMNYIF
jgi:hypothetical protein